MIQREREIEEGRLSKRQIASKWSDAMVKEILDNDFYIGTFRLKKRARNTVHGKDKRVPKEEQCIFENHHPAIIDKATFALVQELKEKRNRTNYRGSRGQWLGSEIPNPFGSCLFCKDCGSRLTPIKRQTSSKERKYYICTTYNTKGRRYCSKAHLIEEDDLMEDVLTYIKMCRNALCEVISTYDLKDFEAEKKTIAEKRQELHTAINERKSQLKVLLTQKVKDLAVAAGNEDLINETYDSMQEVKEALPDDAFYRFDAYGAHNNLGLWFDKSCLQFFNSTVAPSIMEFYPEVGVKRDVNSKPEVQNYALRGLLSVRYTLVAKDADSNWQGEGMDGWDLVGGTSAYQIYENKNWVPMGFAQQYYVTADQLDQVDEDSRAQVLLRAVLLDEDQIAAYGDLLQPIPDDGLTNCTQDTYAEDCTACRAEAVENFTATRTGFTAETDYDTDRLVFFSVPYDDGFTAAINGEPAKIEKVDNGLMALRVPAGQTSITCTYHTPGLRTGTIISLAALAVYGAYLVVLKKRKCL